ncbi:Dolichyldiphosphatase, partial [Termitomyces sp. J132]
QTNLIVTGLTSFVIILTQSVAVVYFAFGALMCTISVKFLKKAIRQPRPVNQTSKQRTTYGMPSTHSATISYYAVYISLACVYLSSHRSFPLSVCTRMFLAVLCLLYGIMVVWSRIWLGHHTWPQVIVGVTHGLIFAMVWFKLWCAGLNQYGSQLEGFGNQIG